MPSETEAATLAFGDVILVPFPFTNQAASKRRPSVVVSSRAYNLARPDVVVMAVTSQFRATEGVGEVWLAGWEAAGMLKPSAIKPVIATLERGLVIRRLGTLGDEDQAALRRAITDILG
ncbi:MAG: type II toxin-antitoxin system PemK/MazF family toxin [Rhodoferax sp.]|nr:type II toxin-antitoxin system PemK/MazF family toxin [Rhodoferax sp.]